MKKNLLILLVFVVVFGLVYGVRAGSVTNDISGITIPKITLRQFESNTVNQAEESPTVAKRHCDVVSFELIPRARGIMSLYPMMDFSSNIYWTSTKIGMDSFFWSFVLFGNGTTKTRHTRGEIGWFVNTTYPLSAVGPDRDDLMTGIEFWFYGFPWRK